MEHALIPLSPRGLAQAACVAELLPAEPALVLVSPYVRARDTARPYCLRVGREAEVHPLLQEFSALDPELLHGMTGEQRRPIADAHWQAADPTVRMGAHADTFLDFDARVGAFMLELPGLPDNSILFGHGIWFALPW
jgi:broad specificity phosphatase PhoE